MSHHYKLNRGVKSVIDTSPPFSMYNSPISKSKFWLERKSSHWNMYLSKSFIFTPNFSFKASIFYRSVLKKIRCVGPTSHLI
ncbi:unnamed protein product [Haemonchus placei]|uniref:Ovule protein n=1 Tax=Haemonchus placei TaxID=6290 RepID=A0A0N4W788_HAEPC|nr:unnamed protein product [Haemonchus placei]